MLKPRLLVILLGLLLLGGTLYAQAPQDAAAVVRYNGIEFSYLPQAFGAVLPSFNEGTPFQTDAPYFANVAPHTTFQFLRPDPSRPDVNWVGELRVYRIADLEAYGEPSYQDVVTQLRTLDTTDLSAYETVSPNYTTPSLPYMPVLNATQVFRAHASAFNTGIEYYTYYSQSPEPLLEGQVFYTYQGISSDGLYYLSFSMPVTLGLLQTSIAPDFDWDSFVANYTTYLTDTYAAISSADPAAFAPTQADLNQFVQSISISG